MLFSALTSVQYCSAQTWTPKKNIPSSPHFEGSACFSAGDKVYMGGGLYTNNILEYDTVANTWTNKTTMPGALLTCRAGAIAFTIHDTAYVGFGYDQNTATMEEPDLYDLWQYNKAANNWVPKHSFPSFTWYKIPNNVFVANGKAYLAGGYDSGTASKQLWEYDPATNEWSQKRDLPAGVYSATTFSLGNKGYLAFCNMDTGNSKALFEYDAIADAWTRKNDIPAPIRLGAISFVINGKAYTGQGGNYAAGTLLTYDDLYVYNAPGDSWAAVDTSPLSGTYINRCVSLGNKAFVGGGKNLLTGAYTKEWYEVTSLLTTGIKPVASQYAIKCFPNPATNTINIAGMPDCKSGCTYEIISLAGMVAKHGVWLNDKINVVQLPAGMYILKLDAGSEMLIAGFEKF